MTRVRWLGVLKRGFSALALAQLTLWVGCGDDEPLPIRSTGEAGANEPGEGGRTEPGAGGANDAGSFAGGTLGEGGSTSAGSGGDTTGSGGDTTGSGGDTAGSGGSPDTEPDFPDQLVDTGLYADGESLEIADDAEPYRPAYELWSDGADKRRWVLLPSGSTVDTSEMDYWTYPVGTKLFKEFSIGDQRIETRMLHKQPRGWVAVSYLWNEAATGATAAPDGARNVLGTNHDVPDQDGCRTCHDKMPDHVLGFTALQLSHAEDGVTLDSLAADGRLSDPPEAPLAAPGDQAARRALGYLHANCGICHHPRSFVTERVALSLWLTAETLGEVETTPTFQSAVGRRAELGANAQSIIIAPGEAAASELILRMQQRGTEEQMPPLASELPDEAGIEIVSAWIDSLEPQ